MGGRGRGRRAEGVNVDDRRICEGIGPGGGAGIRRDGLTNECGGEWAPEEWRWSPG